MSISSLRHTIRHEANRVKQGKGCIAAALVVSSKLRPGNRATSGNRKRPGRKTLMGNSNLRDLEVLIAQAETLSFQLGDKPAELNPDQLECRVDMLCPSFEDRFEFARMAVPFKPSPESGF